MAVSKAEPPHMALLSNPVLAGASALLWLAAVVAIVRGQQDWPQVPVLVWLHLGTILASTALTPVMLLRTKGDRDHRRLGYIWVVAMALTALSSLFFKLGGSPGNLGVFTGDWSIIHLLSIWVLIQVPIIVKRARRHDRAGHERGVRGMVIGALLVAGFFTFPFDRLLGHWLLA
ncbi:MAG: hypothetical protein RL490_1435 [Pseudomonadota bacterium]